MTRAETLEYVLARCEEDGGCWIWQGAMQCCGTTPTFRLPGSRKTTSVRRVVLEARGVKLEGRFATNVCESPRCVAPEHLKAMTRKQLQAKTANTLAPDVKLRRNARLTKTLHSQSKLTAQTVELLRQSPLDTRTLARYMGVSRYAIWAALRGRTWAPTPAANPFAALIARH